MDYKKQTEIFNPADFKQAVNIIGCGATGSWVALTLAKMGVKKLHLWDFDTVEEHNIPNQAFMMQHIGKKKVDALQEIIQDFSSEIEVTTHDCHVNADTKLSGIVFILTDTMLSRNEIFKKALKYNVAVPLVIETRMGLEGGRIYTLNPSFPAHIKAYEKTIYSDEESVESMCGISQTLAPTAMLISSYAVWQLVKWFNDVDIDNELILDAKYNQMIERRF